MYRLTFRIFETLDEHFYAPRFDYHSSYSGFGLDETVLEELDQANARQLAEQAAANARPVAAR